LSRDGTPIYTPKERNEGCPVSREKSGLGTGAEEHQYGEDAGTKKEEKKELGAAGWKLSDDSVQEREKNGYGRFSGGDKMHVSEEEP